MTPSDLDCIERELAIRLPADYRALVLNYPAGLGPSGPDYQLLDDPQQIIETNRLYRAQGFFDLPWPEHFYSMGGDGSGNDYYLDVRLERSPVYFADHEGSIYSEQWPSLDAWLAERIKEQAEWQEEERHRKERKASKKWWQFWLVLAFALLYPADPAAAQKQEAGPSGLPCADPLPVLREGVFDLGVGRVRLRDGAACVVLPEAPGCEWEVKLARTAGVWKPDDPNCCPSQEQRQHYVWEPARKQFFVHDTSVRPLAK